MAVRSDPAAGGHVPTELSAVATKYYTVVRQGTGYKHRGTTTSKPKTEDTDGGDNGVKNETAKSRIPSFEMPSTLYDRGLTMVEMIFFLSAKFHCCCAHRASCFLRLDWTTMQVILFVILVNVYLTNAYGVFGL